MSSAVFKPFRVCKAKIRSVFEGAHLLMLDIISVKLKCFSVVIIDIIVYFELSGLLLLAT